MFPLSSFLSIFTALAKDFLGVYQPVVFKLQGGNGCQANLTLTFGHDVLTTHVFRVRTDERGIEKKGNQNGVRRLIRTQSKKSRIFHILFPLRKFLRSLFAIKS